MNAQYILLHFDYIYLWYPARIVICDYYNRNYIFFNFKYNLREFVP